jgi:hypothetical protein
MAVGNREARIENLQTHINVEFSKGLKGCSNAHLEYELHPLTDRSNATCGVFCFSWHTLSAID